jgi:hypothetical protein
MQKKESKTIEGKITKTLLRKNNNRGFEKSTS